MSCRTITRFLLVCILLCAAVAMAQDESPSSVFQLNGFAGSPAQPGSDNLTDPDPATTSPVGFPCNYGAGPTVCDDWNLLFNNGTNHSKLKEFFPASTDVFRQGTKDTQDVSVWNWNPGSSPGKDAFNEGYAASYAGPFSGDNIVVAGADRATNNGDANIGIWLFQKPVVAAQVAKGGNTVGVFTCGSALCHAEHDIFILSAFTGGGGSSAIEVLEWDATDCSGITTTVKNPAVGSCADTNLKLLLGLGTQCDGSFECAVTNPTTTHTAWEGAIATPQFFEAGVNITAALKNAGVTSGVCFATIEVETRASQSTGAELKAFFLHAFPECQMKIAKACFVGTRSGKTTPYIFFNGSTPFIHYDFDVTVTNPATGGGPIFDPTITDSFPANSLNQTLNGSAYTGPVEDVVNGGIAVNGSVTIPGSFDFGAQGKVTNSITGTASPSEGGTQNITGTTTGDSTGTTTASADFGTGTCSVSPAPKMTLTKFCDITLVGNLQNSNANAGVKLREDDSIQVCNTSTDTTRISNISISDAVSNESSHSFSVSGALLPSACKTFTQSSFPNDCVNDSARGTTPEIGTINPILNADGTVATTPVAGRCKFSDTATITSTPTDEFGNTVTAPLPAHGECNLCLDGFCTAPVSSGGPDH